MTKTYSGFVAIIGPTNAGKSTLLNQIMGQKVSIVSHKVQTTRTRLRAVKMVGDRQLIFVDTPGVFNPKRRLDRAMVAAAMDAVSDADAILLIMDAQKGVTETIRGLVEKIRDRPNLFVALNKVDAVAKPNLLPIVAELSAMANWREIFMISALKNDGVT
ncbi:MAG: GTPase Era, partial [Alphaproteobacteria bacterium]|nr:GTPase Era [Alphaproteobacteria bacterium]